MTLLTLLKATTGGGGVAVSVIDSTTSGNTAFAASRAIPVPNAGATITLLADDVVVVHLSRWESINPTVTTPAGTWIRRTQQVSGNNHIDHYLKRLTGNDTGNYTFSWTGSMWTTGQATIYRGVDPAADLSAIPLHQPASTSGTTWPVATLNSVGNGVLDWHGYSENGGSHAVPTTPAFTQAEANDCDIQAYMLVSAGSFTTSGGSSVSSNLFVSMLHLPEASGGGSSHTQTPSDAEDLTDSSAFSYGPASVDSEPLTDVAALAQGKTSSESLGLTDSASVSFVLDRTASDSLGATDTASLSIERGVAAPDTLGATDSVTLDRSQAPSDASGLTDAAVLSRGVAQASADNLGLTDATVQAIGQGQSDLAGLSDSVAIQASGVASLTPTDTAGLTDSTTLSRSQAASDSEALTDAASLELGRTRTASDNLGLSDQVTLIVTRDLGDVVTLSDTAALIASFIRVLQEDAGLTDTTQVSLTGPTAGTTVRPNTGTTARPGTGVTPRPFTGTTVRPG